LVGLLAETKMSHIYVETVCRTDERTEILLTMRFDASFDKHENIYGRWKSIPYCRLRMKSMQTYIVYIETKCQTVSHSSAWNTGGVW